MQFEVVLKNDENNKDTGDKDTNYIDTLRKKFPMYFDKPVDKGLGIYIWQMAEGSYSCGLLSNTNIGYTRAQIEELQKYPASISCLDRRNASYCCIV